MRKATVAVAMCLGLATGSANAVPVFGTWGGDNINGYTAVFSNNSVGNSFSDWLNFSIPASSDGSGASVVLSNFVNNISYSNWNVIFTVFDLYESANLVASGFTGGIYSALSFNNQAVPGNYSLNVAGYKLDTAQSGGYSGTVSVNPAAPVPEPETYAMLFAGLGLIGFTARRRKQNV